MAEALVGSAILSGAFNVLFDRLATKEVLDFLRSKTAINKLLWELDISLLSAHKLLDDAEEKQIEDDKVEKWLIELKDVFYKAGELTDKIETEALRLKMEGDQSTSDMFERFKSLFPTPLSSFDNGVKDELVDILSLLKHLMAQKDGLGLEAAGRNRSRGVRSRFSERPTPIADESSFCGREDTKAIIIESLLRSDDVSGEKISVVPLIGAGGLGKTTLAQVVYNHPDVKQHFGEDRAWVTVSTEFDLPAITKRIIGQVSGSTQIDGNADQQVLLSKLYETLKGRKFLLVLDDVWSEDRGEWNILKSCFKSGEPGSKVIVTTRSRTVASVAAPNQPQHFLEELPEEECWRLFARTVFTSDQDRDEHPNLGEIGKKIVEKCKGVPLSVVSVAGILCGDRDPEYWETILKSTVWELLQQGSKHIIPSLWLSYLYLPSEIKPCFAYCSIFSKDYLFKKEEVVRQWMAEGFLKNEAGKRGITMEEVGKRYFEELISRSLFQRSKERVYFGEFEELISRSRFQRLNYGYRETFIMHDLVPDLAMKVSGEFCFFLEGEKNLRDLSSKTRYLSCNKEIQDVKKFEGSSKAKRLHSFVGLQGIRGDILRVLEESAIEGRCLRVLSLHRVYPMMSVPDSIGDLKHLRYLNLSGNGLKKLPDSVGALYNLQTLLLSKCRRLTQLPSTMGSLINLRHLDTRETPLEEMPPHMCNLTKLQTLSDFVVGKRGSSIRDLGALHDLKGELRISGLQNVDDVLKGNLEDKKNLSKLVLQWKGQTDDSIKDRTVLDALQPHGNLKELSISGYGGTSFPVWVLFSKIEKMRLNGCQDCLFLPSLGRLSSLKELKMKGFHKLETIDDEFYGNDSPFKSLEVLHFSDMPELKRWSVIEVPRLKELKLKGCPKLVGGLPSCKTLTTLRIDKCPKLEYSGNQCRYPSLESLEIRQSCRYIRRLSLEHLTKLNKLVLTELDWLVELTGESSNEVKRLFIEKCPKLEFLGNSRYGSLENLKIEQCEALNSIPLDYFPKLNGLTLRYCQNFESFRFGEEAPLVLESLSFLKLTGLPKFVSFPEGGLPAPNLKDFYIEECENLRALPQQMHRLLPSLQSLKVTYCGKIKWWPEAGLLSNLESLDILGCKKLAAQVMHWDLQLTCLKSLRIDGYGEELLDSFPPEGLLATSLTSLKIHNFRRLKTLNIHAFQHLDRLTVENCYELQCLPEESLPNSLSYLKIEVCPLLGRRYRKETGEGWHKISHIPQVWINDIKQH